MAVEATQGRRVVLVPFPYQGHLSPILQLGAILHSRHGFSITVALTNFNFPKDIPSLPFQFIRIPDHLSNTEISSNDFINIAFKLNDNCKAPFKDLLVRFLDEEEAGMACVIYDGSMYFAEEVAAELGIPSMVFRTFCAGYVRIYKEYPRFIEEGHIPEEGTHVSLLRNGVLCPWKAEIDPSVAESRSHELVPGLHPLRYKDLPTYKLTGFEGVLRILDRASHIGSSSAILINTTEALDLEALEELKKHHQIPVLAVGPLHKIAPPVASSLLQEDEGCIEWLDGQAKGSVLYISIGSLASVDEKEFIEMAWGLANSEQPFLWVVRPGSVRGSEWTELLPREFFERVGERGLIIKWAPQKQVLAHESMGGFWSHCGWNSTLESLSEGVPMICTPSFGDQRVNERYLSCVWRVGIVVEKMEREGVEGAVRELMVGEEGKMVELKERIDRSIRDGGSSDMALNEVVKLISSSQLMDRKT